MEAFETAAKTVMDLALELGVRSETVLQALKGLGLEADDLNAPVDPDIEELLVDQLIGNGAIPNKMKGGKGRRARTAEPMVNDDLVFEALGASEEGFSEKQIPRQIRIESTFAEKPNWFNRLFKKKKDLVRSLKETDHTDQDLQTMFAPVTQRERDGRPSPFEEAPEDYEAVQEGLDEGPGFEMDEDLLGEIEELDIDLADLEELEEFAESEEVEAPPAEEAAEGEEVPEEGEIEIEVEGEGEAPTPEAGEEVEEEIPPGFIERIISRIHLTPTELWTLTGGSLLIMFILLGVTVYWWLNISPKAEDGIWRLAEAAYLAAKDPNTTKPIDKYQEAADGFLDYLDRFPQGTKNRLAFEYLCDSYRKIATIHEAAGEKDKSIEPYRKSIVYYEQYLHFLEEQANKLLGVISTIPDPNLAQTAAQKAIYQTFPDAEQQENALINIAEARWKLDEFPQAVQSYRSFVQRFGDSDKAIEARLNIGRIYQNWAEINKEQELQLLGEAIGAYEEALQEIPANLHRDRMDLYYGLGTIKKTLYDRTRSENQNEENANSHLIDAIAYLEKAEGEARDVQHLPIEDQVRIFKYLGDLYLIRGHDSGKEWRERQELAELYPDDSTGENHKQQLLQGAEREKRTTEDNLGKAMNLFDELLKPDSRKLLDPKDEFDILYNYADALRILQRFPEALSTGEQLVAELESKRPVEAEKQEDIYKLVRTKTYYLLGHISWEMANNRDYSRVKKYYRKALEEDGFFPKEEHGEISHLAEIRLTNVYFMLDKKYDEAISQFASTVDRFPEDGYSYLTFYWYAKALQEYGNDLRKQADAIEADIKKFGKDTQKDAEIKNLRAKANELYGNAIDQFGRAIAVRDKSRYVDTRDQQYLVDIYFQRGHCAFNSGRYVGNQSAEEYFTLALNEFSNHPVAKGYIAAAIERLGDLNALMADYDKAILWYGKYLKEGYPDPDARINMKLADTYATSLSFDKARAQYRKIIEDHPLPTQRQIDREKRMGNALTLGPGYEAFKKLAQSFYDQAGSQFGAEREEKLKQALDTYKQFAALFPESNNNPAVPSDIETQRIIGNLYYKLEDYPNAAANYEAFLHNNPNFNRKGILQYRIGDSYMQMNNLDKAIETLNLITENTLDTPSQYADCLLRLAKAYQDKANLFRDSGDDIQYETFLKKAFLVYTKAAQIPVKEKADQATLARLAIDRILENRKEVANAQTLAQ